MVREKDLRMNKKQETSHHRFMLSGSSISKQNVDRLASHVFTKGPSYFETKMGMH